MHALVIIEQRKIIFLQRLIITVSHTSYLQCLKEKKTKEERIARVVQRSSHDIEVQNFESKPNISICN